jgi:hypothetical protein
MTDPPSTKQGRKRTLAMEAARSSGAIKVPVTLGVDTLGIELATFGFLNPVLAAGIHVPLELVFILNSARLLPTPEKTIEAHLNSSPKPRRFDS